MDGHDAPEGAAAARPVGAPEGYAEGDLDGGGVGVARRAEVLVGRRVFRPRLGSVWLLFGPRELCVAASLKVSTAVVAAAATAARCGT